MASDRAQWFCSAPMSDNFLTLAQTPKGLTCFLVPRWLDRAHNTVRIHRLKGKPANRSNASAEIEYDRTLAHQIGEQGRGVRTIVEMVYHTRLDTAFAPAGLMRTVLADLTPDWEGTLALGMRVAIAFDGTSQDDRIFARIGVALAKLLANMLCPVVIGEAMEVLGGMGYVEDTPLPMLHR